MGNIKIAFFDTKPYDVKSFEEINKNFGFSIKFFESHLNAETAPLVKGYDAVCAFVNDSISSEVIDILHSNNIKLIALRCAGYNNVDLKHVFKKIHVAIVPAYSPYAVAEHAVALMLSLNRKIHKAHYRTHDNNFSLNGLLGFDMHGKTAAVIGTGKIGKSLISILKGFGMNVLAYDKFQDKEAERSLGFTYVDLDTIYRDSDIISLNCPLTSETKYMINEETLSKMKDGVMLINTGRGLLIESSALIDALKTGKVGFAGLDVYEEENQYFFEDFSGSFILDDVLARLLTFNNVIVTGHQAFFTKEALANIANTTLNNIKTFFAGDDLKNEVCYRCNGICNKKENGKCF